MQTFFDRILNKFVVNFWFCLTAAPIDFAMTAIRVLFRSTNVQVLNIDCMKSNRPIVFPSWCWAYSKRLFDRYKETCERHRLEKGADPTSAD